MRPLSYAFLTSASFAALAIAAPANAQTPEPVIPGGDPCQAPADQRQPGVTCPPADSPAGEAVLKARKLRLRTRVSSSSVRASVATASTPPIRSRSSIATQRSTRASTRRPKCCRAWASPAVPGRSAIRSAVWSSKAAAALTRSALRGLGPTRTLVLLNGRRIAPAGTRGQVGAADLNVLPNSILDRIEVLNTGASSVYGSDAVAGVINIVTLSKFNGLAVEASIQAPEIGAGTAQRYSITAGTSGERFSLLGSIELYDRNRITQGDQPWARCPQQRRNAPFNQNDSTKCFPLEEGGVTVNTIGTGFVQIGHFTRSDRSRVRASPSRIRRTMYLLCNRWRPVARTTDALPGFECVGGLLYNYYHRKRNRHRYEHPRHVRAVDAPAGHHLADA